MKDKHEHIRGDRLYYCFVDFQDSDAARPIVYVMPSATVAETIAATHKKWLETPGVKGQQRKDGPLRRLLPDYGKTFAKENPYPAGWLAPYRDAWHLLKLDPSDPSDPPPVLADKKHN